MPRQRTATHTYDAFKKNLARSEAFLTMFDEGNSGPGRPTNQRRQLLAASLVFAIGALDAYLHDLLLEVVPLDGGDRSNMASTLQAIAKDDPSLALRISLAPTASDRREEFREALEAQLDKKTYHGVKRVKEAMNLIGCKINYPLAFPQGWEAALERHTDNRHKVVHRGIPPAVNRRKEASEPYELVKVIVSVIDAEGAKQCLNRKG